MSDWVILGEYLNKEVLVQNEAILKANEITFRVKMPETHLNSAFGQANSQPFIIEVLEDQFELAKELIHDQDDNSSADEVALNEYDIEELKEIVLNPEEWHRGFVNRATAELNRRGIEVAESEIAETKREKVRQTEKGEEPAKTVYYFMWGFALLGGYIGIISGYFYWKGKTKGIDGKRYFIYTEKYRKYGFYMFFLAITSAVVQTYLYLKFT